MKKIKVMTVVGTRPEIIRLSRVIDCLDKNTQHILVNTGQNFDYELNKMFFDDMEIRNPDYFLEAAAGSVAATIGAVIAKIDPVLEKERPDAFLVLGDTNSCLCSIPAKRRKIPVFHMEAGNRCFDQRVPEEINRKIIDHISDINLPYSSIAREYLLREGLPPDRIIKTGSPMFEVLTYYSNKIEESDILAKLGLIPLEYFVASFHREENVDNDVRLAGFCSTINEMAEIFGKRIIVSTHPRTRKRIEEKGIKLHEKIELLKPLGFLGYIKLQKNAIATLSDSGTITEESSILNFPALNLREAHERPEGMEEGSVMMTGLDTERILQAVDILSRQNRGESRLLRSVEDYTSPNVSEKILRIILSYVDYVNKKTWLSGT